MGQGRCGWVGGGGSSGRRDEGAARVCGAYRAGEGRRGADETQWRAPSRRATAPRPPPLAGSPPGRTAADDVLVQLQVRHVATQAAARQLVVLGAVALLLGCAQARGGGRGRAGGGLECGARLPGAAGDARAATAAPAAAPPVCAARALTRLDLGQRLRRDQARGVQRGAVDGGEAHQVLGAQVWRRGAGRGGR